VWSGSLGSLIGEFMLAAESGAPMPLKVRAQISILTSVGRASFPIQIAIAIVRWVAAAVKESK